MISGIVLAAGSSRRMGSPKALLKINDKTFLQHVVEVLHSARIIEVVIVLGSEAEVIQQSLSWFTGKIVVNENWQKGQLTSIIAGINSLDIDKSESEEVHGVMICPIDHPLISQSILVDLLQGFWVSKKYIIIPTFNGKRGHPVIFSRELLRELHTIPYEIGARAMLHKHPEKIFEVPVNDEGILININTPEDYRKYING